MTAGLTRTASPSRPTISRRTHVLGAVLGVLVVVIGLGVTAAFGLNPSHPNRPTVAAAGSTTSPAPVPSASATDTPHPTTSVFDAPPSDNPSPPPIDYSVSVSAVRQGDCLRDPIKKDGLVGAVIDVDCSEKHAIEVYATFDLKGTAFPGLPSVRRQAVAGCESRFSSFNGRSAGATALELSDLHPTSDSWSVSNRTVRCLVAEPNEKPRTGSLRNSHR